MGKKTKKQSLSLWKERHLPFNLILRQKTQSDKAAILFCQFFYSVTMCSCYSVSVWKIFALGNLKPGIVPSTSLSVGTAVEGTAVNVECFFLTSIKEILRFNSNYLCRLI